MPKAPPPLPGEDNSYSGMLKEAHKELRWMRALLIQARIDGKISADDVEKAMKEAQ